MKKSLILVPVAALAIGGGALFAGTTLFPQAEDRIEVKMDAAEMKVEETVNSALTKVGMNTNAFSDDDDDVAPIETPVGFVDMDDDFREVPANILSAEQAVDIAKQHAKGTLTSIELDEENGETYYEVEFQDGQTEYTIDLHAVTGDIVEVDEDRD